MNTAWYDYLVRSHAGDAFAAHMSGGAPGHELPCARPDLVRLASTLARLDPRAQMLRLDYAFA